MATYLFLGGWHGPSFLPPEIWFLIKLYGLFVILVWIRAALPRISTDQILEIGWKRLLPLSLLNILITIALYEGGWLIWAPVFFAVMGILLAHMFIKERRVAVHG